MVNPQEFDIAIIGGGPAGCAAAIRLSGQGHSVALIERATFPRDKVCGDALSVDVVKQLERLDPALSLAFEQMADKLPALGIRLVAPNGREVDLDVRQELVQTPGYVSSRLTFDNLLFQHVLQRTNTKVLQQTEVKEAEKEPNGFRLATSEGEIRARLVLAADGANSVLSRGQQFNDKEHYAAGLRVYYENVQGFHASNLIELHFYKEILPGYLWVFPMAGGKANVGIGAPTKVIKSKGIHLRQLLDKLIREQPGLKERFREAKALETVKGAPLPLASGKRPLSGDHFMLLGDAASLIDPFSGEGIGNAIRSGRFAAEIALQAFEENRFDADYLQAYDQKIQKAMSTEFKVSSALQKVARYPHLLNIIARLANRHPAFHRLMCDALMNEHLRDRFTQPRELLRKWKTA